MHHHHDFTMDVVVFDDFDDEPDKHLYLKMESTTGFGLDTYANKIRPTCTDPECPFSALDTKQDDAAREAGRER